MGLQIGIIGLPNVGKSTTFNALTRSQIARVASFPFCTIEPNRAMVPVPDDRLDRLHELAAVPNRIPATIEFLDIAGLVKGASQGEGLGNQFLGDIRTTDAILHVVRCFEDPNVAHVEPEVDPVQDVEIINLELILADLEQLEKKGDRLERQVKGDKGLGPYLDMVSALKAHLQSGRPIRNYSSDRPEIFIELNKEMSFLTAKPVLYVANVDEAGLGEENPCVDALADLAAQEDAPIVTLCAHLEEEILELSPDEQAEFLRLAGVPESGLDQVIRLSYRVLGLISFFTLNENEVRAWPLRRGWTASQAAGLIHSDFERGFIKAEVVPFEIFDRLGGTSQARVAGEMRLEGKNYVVQDGDVIYVHFNV